MPIVKTGTRGRAARCGVTLGAMAIALVVTACQAPSGSSGQSSGGQSVTVAAVPGIDNAPLQVAAKHGLFAAHGLSVTVQSYATLRQAYAALVSGRAQIISGDYANLLYQQTTRTGIAVKLVADGYDATAGILEVLTLPDSGITTPAQLANKTVATPPAQLIPFSRTSPYNIETLATDSVLQSNGVSPSSIHWKPMPLSNMINALHAHVVSAIVAPEPYILQAEARFGALELLDAFSGATASLPVSGYFASASFARSNADALASFRAALNEAKADASQRGVVQPMISGMPGMSAQEAALITMGQYPTFLNTGQIQRVADLMYGAGMIRNTISVKSLVAG